MKCPWTPCPWRPKPPRASIQIRPLAYKHRQLKREPQVVVAFARSRSGCRIPTKSSGSGATARRNLAQAEHEAAEVFEGLPPPHEHQEGRVSGAQTRNGAKPADLAARQARQAGGCPLALLGWRLGEHPQTPAHASEEESLSAGLPSAGAAEILFCVRVQSKARRWRAGGCE